MTSPHRSVDAAVTECPLCGQGPVQIPFPTLVTLAECPACRMMFRTDRFSLDAPNAAYEEGEDSIRRLLSQEPRRAPYYRMWAKRLERIVTPPGPLLEIGVGAGGLLKSLIERGWEAEGVESSNRLCDIARKSVGGRCPIHPIRLDEAETHLKLRPFGAILALDVLEHLPDIFLLPTLAREWLRPSGVLFLQTPNSQSLRRFIQKTGWEQLAPAEHYVFHSASSLRRLLDRSGYTDVQIRTTSGTATDRGARRAIMAIGGGLLRGLGVGNALLAVARKGN